MSTLDCTLAPFAGQIPSVAVDGKVSFAAALCNYMNESVIQHPLVDQAVPCGCLAFPALGRRACARHAGASTLAPADGDSQPPREPTRCPAEHALQRLLRDDLWHHACDHCAVALVVWRQLLDLRCMQQ